MRTRRQTGFSLVEVLSVLVLLGILAAVVISFFVDLDGEARRKGILAALSELNGREQQAWAKEMMETRGAATDAAVFAQVDPGNLGNDYVWVNGPEADGVSHLSFQGFEAAVYRTPSQPKSPGIWRASEGSSFDFGATGTEGFLQFDERGSNPEPWVESGGGISANSEWAQLLRENPLAAGADSAYELGLEATLGDWEGPYQGYGIFFNTTLQADGSGIEDGYAVQFDPGLGDGKIIVREWRDGRQLVSSPAYTFDDYTVIPRIRSDRDWWTSEHQMELEVTPGSSGGSQLAVYVDGELLFDDFSFTHAPGTTYTGLRSWGDYTEASEFNQLDVTAYTPGP